MIVLGNKAYYNKWSHCLGIIIASELVAAYTDNIENTLNIIIK